MASTVTAPDAMYEVGGRHFDIQSIGFATAIADSYATRTRPRCQCVPRGVEMYTARLGHGYIIKRMPETGSQHAPDCPSYEPPTELSGLGPLLGSAIREDPVTGQTVLKLDFPLSRRPGRSASPTGAAAGGSAQSAGTKLSLRSLLFYLWDQAGLTKWHPGFSGKRNWATVRNHLLLAAEGKVAKGDALEKHLYIPEPFIIEQRDEINARRMARWRCAKQQPGRPQHLLLMVCEVKAFTPARFGHKAIVKHVPDQAFCMDEPLYRQVERRFESELAFWGADDDIHLVMIATFAPTTAAAVPTLHHLCVMPVTRQWLPVADSFEKRLVDRLVGEGRRFVKVLRYSGDATTCLPVATLMDLEESTPPTLCLRKSPGATDRLSESTASPVESRWIWQCDAVALPPLPAPRWAG